MKGLLQLIIYGTQDLFLTGNPHISHFKVLYRRHTLFSIEEKNIILRNKHKLGTTIKKEIPKQGDLLDNLMLNITIPKIETFLQCTKEQELAKLSLESYQDILKKQYFLNKCINLISDDDPNLYYL